MYNVHVHSIYALQTVYQMYMYMYTCTGIYVLYVSNTVQFTLPSAVKVKVVDLTRVIVDVHHTEHFTQSTVIFAGHATVLRPPLHMYGEVKADIAVITSDQVR